MNNVEINEYRLPSQYRRSWDCRKTGGNSKPRYWEGLKKPYLGLEMGDGIGRDNCSK